MIVKKNTPLMLASKEGNLDLVKKILSEHPNEIDKQNRNRLTALMFAILNNRLDIVKELLKNGASTVLTKKGKNIFKICVDLKHNYPESGITRDELFKLINIKCNDNVNKQEEINKFFSSKPNNKKYYEDSFKILEEVIKHTIDNDHESNYCLLYSIGSGKYHKNLIKENLKNYSKLDKKDNYGNTFLIYASKYGHLSVVKELIDMGISIHDKNNFGNDALTYATRNGHTEVVNELKKNI